MGTFNHVLKEEHLYRKDGILEPKVLHVYGTYPDVQFRYGWAFQTRALATIAFVKDVFEKYKDVFRGVPLDFYIWVDDRASHADEARRTYHLKHIFAYSEMPWKYPGVVAIPDFVYTAWPEVGIPSWEETVAECQQRGKEPWKDARCFWIGNVATHPKREILARLGDAYPEFLKTPSMHWDESKKDGDHLYADRYVSLPDHTDYKYLIDVQGAGWSARLKILLQMGRVVFIEERDPREFYFSYLQDMENCVIVRSDLSDLISKIRKLEADDALYQHVAKGANVLAETYLSKDYAMKYMKDKMLEYGVKAS